ncbi:ABC transporter permease [Rhizobium lusitanum]|uniref:ABC-type spermidine/putrescine transport system permease subunit II n=1 Tax=Rhizobium lusitanum TaxID=293958 RepID=A0A7X0MG19_9HYPH|nr:ABC transporter permease [Rhizobium lusitanum]MBB6487720.1 ABC-type spermidine/putrescine transport system permease subunit II [Rhizobium lusitanum]
MSPFSTRREGGPGLFLRLMTLLTAILIVLPTFVVIPASFTAGETLQFPPREWSLRWYENFFTSRVWLSSLLQSLQIASLTAILATVLGVAAAIGLTRIRRRTGAALRVFFSLPLTVPSVVIGIAIYAVFLKWHLAGTLSGLVLAHTALAIPFVITTVAASLTGYDNTLDLASSSLGAGSVTTLLRIKIPLLAPGVISGFLFAFVSSFDEFVVALFLQTPKLRTLPVQMYNSIALDMDPTISAASSVIVVATTLIFLFVSLRAGNKL